MSSPAGTGGGFHSNCSIAASAESRIEQLGVTIPERYRLSYRRSLSAFVDAIFGVNPKGFPEPHLPLWGVDYEAAPIRVLYVGIDARGWGGMDYFLHRARENHDLVLPLDERLNEFRGLAFTGWTNRPGISFWDFVMRIHAGIHQVADWRDLKYRRRPDLLRNFAWANCNAMECWTDGNRRAWFNRSNVEPDFTEWRLFKNAAEQHLDRLDRLLDIFQPRVAIIANSEPSESFLRGSLVTGRRVTPDLTPISAFDHERTGALIIQCQHPHFLGRRGMIRKSVTAIVSEIHRDIGARLG